MTNTRPQRVPHDFYPTPAAATRALLFVEQFTGTIWEPACGNGAISKVLNDHGYTVVSTDLIDRGFGTGGVNFLTQKSARAHNIVTNPPYSSGLGDAFVLHALRLVEPNAGSVAMLLNLASLAHPKRHRFWTTKPPATIFVLDECVCWPNGVEQGYAAEQRYCWAIWRPQFRGRAALWWLSTTGYT